MVSPAPTDPGCRALVRRDRGHLGSRCRRRRAVAQGVVSYLIKPFTFAGFRTKLEQYVRYREQMAASDTRAIRRRRHAGHPAPTLSSTDLPKGLTMTTLT